MLLFALGHGGALSVGVRLVRPSVRLSVWLSVCELSELSGWLAKLPGQFLSSLSPAPVAVVLASNWIVGVPAERALAARPGAHVEPAAVVVAVVAAMVAAVMVAVAYKYIYIFVAESGVREGGLAWAKIRRQFVVVAAAVFVPVDRAARLRAAYLLPVRDSREFRD